MKLLSATVTPTIKQNFDIMRHAIFLNEAHYINILSQSVVPRAVNMPHMCIYYIFFFVISSFISCS